MKPVDPDLGVFGISVAAELSGLGVQALRLYETRGLLEPARTAGGTRRYSANDLDRLRRIGELLDAGLNLTGVGMVLDLEQRNSDLVEQNSQLRAEKEEQWQARTPTRRSRPRRPTSSNSKPPPSGTR